MQTFDLIIIGSGSGNSLVTADFDGKRVAIVERGVFGGTCLNVGCIPTKMFVYTAELAEAVSHLGRFGLEGRLDGVDWRQIRDRVFDRIDPISSGGRNYRIEGPNTTAFLGSARFVGPRELEVRITDAAGEHQVGSVQRITADQIVVATGSRPVIPGAFQAFDIAQPGAAHDPSSVVHTSDSIMRIDELPARLAIVGGGFVAMEFAHIFAGLGVQVSVIARSGTLVRHLDQEISDRFTTLAAEHWDLHLNTAVRRVERPQPGDGRAAAARLHLSDGTTLDTDLILLATGRRPNADDLGLEAAGIQVDDDGVIVLDEFGRTTADGVYALGDVANHHQLKHVANREARIVAHNLAHPDDLRPFAHPPVPSAVFTRPQIATVGLTEQQAEQAGHDVVTALQDYGATAYGWAMEDRTGVVKLVGDRATGTVIGAHYLGPHASTLIQPVIQAIGTGAQPEAFARDQYWIHPALMEVTENALLALADRLGASDR